jgi:hypothetical protein
MVTLQRGPGFRDSEIQVMQFMSAGLFCLPDLATE